MQIAYGGCREWGDRGMGRGARRCQSERLRYREKNRSAYAEVSRHALVDLAPGASKPFGCQHRPSRERGRRETRFVRENRAPRIPSVARAFRDAVARRGIGRVLPLQHGHAVGERFQRRAVFLVERDAVAGPKWKTRRPRRPQIHRGRPTHRAFRRPFAGAACTFRCRASGATRLGRRFIGTGDARREGRAAFSTVLGGGGCGGGRAEMSACS